MKAAVLFELNQPLQIIALPVKNPKAGQVLVKLAYAGLCRTQLLEIAGKNASGPMNPNMMGHEGSGIVEEVGKGVTKVQKGDHVILSWIKGSGQNVLPDTYDYEGKSINCGYVTTFNEYTLASENRVTKIPDKMPLKEASIIGCSVATGAGAVLNNAKVKEGQSVAVFGVGGVGVNMVQAADMVASDPIIAIDIIKERLHFVTRFGAKHIINPKESDVKTEINNICPDGLDFAFDTTGLKENMELAYEIASKTHGTAILAGVPNPPGTKIEIDPFPLYYGRSLRGTGGGETNPDVDFEKFCNLFMDGTYNLTDMLTDTFGLDHINEGLDMLRKGDGCKIVIEYP